MSEKNINDVNIKNTLKYEDDDDEDYNYTDNLEKEDDTDDSNEDYDYEELDEIIKEIVITYIPKLKNAINLFDKDSLINFFNEFLDNQYKSKDIVEDYLLFIKKYKTGLDIIYTLSDSITYNLISDPLYFKNMYNNPYPICNDLLNRTFDNPLDLIYIDTNTKSEIFNISINNNEKIIIEKLEILKKYIEFSNDIYKTNLHESLYSKINKIIEFRDEKIELIFEYNDFDYINDIMCRFGKDILHMTSSEYNKIPKYDVIKKNKKNITKQNSKPYIIWEDNISKFYDDTLIDYTEDDIESILTKYTNKNATLGEINLIYNDTKKIIEDIANNIITVEDLEKNIKDYINSKEYITIIKQFLKIKNEKKNIQVNFENINNKMKYLKNSEKVFNDPYVFPIELIEVFDNEAVNDLNHILIGENYNFIQNDDIVDNIVIINSLENKLINELGLNININLKSKVDLLYDKDVDEYERIPAVIFYLYYEIQKLIYKDDFELDAIDLNIKCQNVWFEYSPPLVLDNNKFKYANKSVFKYILCCFENISNDKLSLNTLLSNIEKLYKLNSSFEGMLIELNNLYSILPPNLTQENDHQMYKKLIYRLKNDLEKNNINIHYNYVEALKYIVPKKLKRVDNFIMGCCSQLLNSKYQAFHDIKVNKNNGYITPINSYMEKFKTVNNYKWNVINYIPVNIMDDIEKPSYLLKEYTDTIINTDIDNKTFIDTYLNEVNLNLGLDVNIELLKNKNALDKYINEKINNYLSYVPQDYLKFSLKKFILEDCANVKNLKILINSGIFNINNKTHYDIIIKYNMIIKKIENIYYSNFDFYNKQANLYIFLAGSYLNILRFQNTDNARNLIQNLKFNINNIIPTRIEYNKQINNYRENLKNKTISSMELLSKTDKELARELKDAGIIKSYEDFVDNMKNFDNDEKDIVIYDYKGEDINDIDLEL